MIHQFTQISVSIKSHTRLSEYNREFFINYSLCHAGWNTPHTQHPNQHLMKTAELERRIDPLVLLVIALVVVLGLRTYKNLSVHLVLATHRSPYACIALWEVECIEGSRRRPV
jgi:hypothetical protein